MAINNIRYFIYILTLFVGESITDKLGIYHKIIMIIIAILSCFIIFITKSYKYRREELVLCLFIVICTIIEIIINSDAINYIILGFFLFVPPVVLLSYPVYNEENEKNINFKRELYRILIIFYLFECGIAIYEYITHSYVFSFNDSSSNISDRNYLYSSFRSIGMHGHPLENALIVSTIMCFFLTSSLKPFYKYSFWLLGYIAILCFNTRSSIVGCFLLLITYIIYQILFRKVSKIIKLSSCLFLLLSILLIPYLLLSGRLGGRLIEMGLFDDGSSKVRIDTWRIFDYYDLSYFLTGMNVEDRQYLLASVTLHSTENFWIDWLIHYGVIFLVLLLILYYALLKKLLTGYALIDKIFVLSSFILIASTNNSLTWTCTPLLIFLFCCIIFNPHIKLTN